MVTILLNYFKVNFINSCFSFDIFIRINLSDFFLFNFYFFWTSAHYLIPFIVSSLLIIYFAFSYFYSMCFYFITFITLIYTVNIISIDTLLHTNWHAQAFENYKVNSLLINKVNKIHPFLFYISFFIFFMKPLPLILRKFQLAYLQNFFSLYVVYAITILGISLYLGSWWALQEGSWGGWWNWDPSEVFGLLLLYILIRGYHLNFCTPSFYSFSYFFSFYLIFILFYYFLMQLNFILIAHNFGFRKKYFFFEKFFLGSLVTCLFTLAVLSNYVRSLDIKHFIASKCKTPFLVFGLIFLMIVIIIVAPATLLNRGLYLGSLTSITVSLMCMLILVSLTLIIFIKFNMFGILYSIYAIPYIFWNCVLVIQIKAKLSYVYHHIAVFFILLITFFTANKLHSWIPLGLVYEASFTLSKLSLHTLFLNEFTSTELFTKTYTYKTFEQFFIDKALFQVLLLADNFWSPPLNTIDYSLPYLSISIAYSALVIVTSGLVTVCL